MAAGERGECSRREKEGNTAAGKSPAGRAESHPTTGAHSEVAAVHVTQGEEEERQEEEGEEEEEVEDEEMKGA